MFEDSLVVSQVHHISSPERWTALASISLQFALAALVITLPFLHPEKLAFRTDAPRILMPLPLKPAVPIEHVQTSSASSGMTTPNVARSLMAPRVLPTLLPQQNDAPVISPIAFGMADRNPLGAAIGDAMRGPHIAVVPAHPSNSPVHVSLGVSAGMLLTPIHPIYPEIARIARVQGTVVVEAIISRTGTIESLRAITGPPMLRQAALDAIRAARYRPYRLNGSPTEVQTTITVNFRLGS
jgi:protein TonB